MLRTCGVALTALLMIGAGASAADPISVLKQRSADERWREAAGNWTTISSAKSGATPAVGTPARTGQPTMSSLPRPELSGSLNGGYIPPAPLDTTLTATAADIGDGDVSLAADLSSSRSTGALGPQLAPADLTLVEASDRRLTLPVLTQGAPSSPPGFPMTPTPSPDSPMEGRQPEAVPQDSALPGRIPEQTTPSNVPATRYSPIPLAQVLPYHDYSPQGIDFCPSPNARCPIDQTLPVGEPIERDFAPLEFYWQASNIFNPPLYFEDPDLERTGHIHHPLIQPFASLGRFGVQFAGLPYFMAIKPPHVCESPLGHYRPGECAPYQYEPFPLNGEAALVAAGVYTAIGFIFPF